MDNTCLEEFIDIYKENRCLWDIKSSNYSNRQSRNTALQELLELLKKYDATANIASVRKKIDTLRTNYNRERKKVQSSIRTGSSPDEIYVPSLWYYNRLKFLSDTQDAARAGADSLEENMEQENTEATSFKTPNTRKKAKSTQKRILDMVEQLSQDDNNNERDEYEAFGRMIGLEVKKLGNPYQTIAQKLISDVIFYSKIGKLTADSYIATPQVPTLHASSSYSSTNSQLYTPSPEPINSSIIFSSPSPVLRTPTPNGTYTQFSPNYQNYTSHSELEPPVLHTLESTQHTQQIAHSSKYSSAKAHKVHPDTRNNINNSPSPIFGTNTPFTESENNSTVTSQEPSVNILENYLVFKK